MSTLYTIGVAPWPCGPVYCTLAACFVSPLFLLTYFPSILSLNFYFLLRIKPLYIFLFRFFAEYARTQRKERCRLRQVYQNWLRHILHPFCETCKMFTVQTFNSCTECVGRVGIIHDRSPDCHLVSWAWMTSILNKALIRKLNDGS